VVLIYKASIVLPCIGSIILQWGALEVLETLVSIEFDGVLLF